MLTRLQTFLDRPVGQMSVRELLLVGVVAAIAIIVVGKVRRHRLRQGLAAHTVEVRCLDCQWRGRAGRYVRRCPKCGSAAIQTATPEGGKR
ncbi:MAG: hypothetical protein GW783_10850 [Deltaproteobacteria bacterium]|nr:hypothetical protein [Deltaproteobacteria bacterium]NCP95423.1 hypothetical protein [Deltaproteobacteria bacterium]NCS74608.1 hypothetical protein [Deltaproteobacteria bacterium]OIP67652.1 MAG: hypothetical protein AUK30_00390 [Nitrospirae bacterium CG2_30_70_394]